MSKKLIAIFCLAAALMWAPPVRAFDPRESQMRRVLESYKSPLIGKERVLIRTAEEFGLDWTLLAAISGTESGFARRMPYQCNNPFGWGIYGTKKLCFVTLEDAIKAVGKGIGTKYNTTSLETIGRTYNKVTTDSWISKTRFFMNKIKNTGVQVEELPITI